MRFLVPLIALAACSGKSSGPSLPAEGEVAGVVVELSGAATAQSPGQSKARPLRPGSELVAGDVVATEEGASLRARLYHNRAVLVLGGGKMLALRDSPAWKAQPAAGSLLEGEVAGDSTAVAGRHAENQSADTVATGRQPTPEPTGQPPPEPKPQPPAEDPKQPTDDWGVIGEPGSLGKDEVTKGMLMLEPLLSACWSQNRPGTAAFSYRLRVSVRPDGKVRAVEVDETTGEPPAEVTRCVVAAVKKVSFPRSARGVTFTYPVQFKPQ